YGSRWAWLVLVLLALAGVAVRHFMLTRTARDAWLLGGAAAAVAVAFVLTAPETPRARDAEESTAPAKPKAPIDPATVGTISGTVRLEGAPPARAPLSMASDCAPLHREPVLSESVVSEGGLLANAL